LIGFSVAERLWPGQEDNVVLLTPNEMKQWHDFYHHPEASFWWFSYYQWEIEDPPKTIGIWADARVSVPDDEDPWLVISGLTWGSLAGGGDAKLWSWDGTRARFIDDVCCWSC
jgi:hypothetical protein